ncbi:unnamed protein product [Prorocentrum cordatum]|uniref:Uncharacterized protein n=1 Tax=Prorocentrum cordatum TaxID=2364126 RepID=A0ABN9T4B1_9DINO|nr:unnamed protein product [Polarella glacialis]
MIRVPHAAHAYVRAALRRRWETIAVWASCVHGSPPRFEAESNWLCNVSLRSRWSWRHAPVVLAVASASSGSARGRAPPPPPRRSPTGAAAAARRAARGPSTRTRSKLFKGYGAEGAGG